MSSDVDTMVDNNFLSISPCIVEHVEHDEGGFIPNESVIALDKKYQPHYPSHNRRVVTVHIRKCGRCDLPESLPFFTFRCNDVNTKVKKYRILMNRFRETMASSSHFLLGRVITVKRCCSTTYTLIAVASANTSCVSTLGYADT